MKQFIYYPPGCYGTFINWICDTNQCISVDDLPFGEFGNSHKYYNKNPGLLLPKQRELFLKSNRDFGVQRGSWPFNVGIKLLNFNQAPDFFYSTSKQDIADMIDACDQILVVHPTAESRVWWYQNYCEKVLISQQIIDRNIPLIHKTFENCLWMTEHDPVLRARHHLDLQRMHVGIKELYNKFDKNTALDFETWQLRQTLAWELHSQGSDYYQCWQKISTEFDKIKFVSLEQLRDNFNSTVCGILDYFDINTEIVNSLDYIESEWSQRQEHRFKDHTVNTIVKSILSGQSLDWTLEKLNLFDEVYIEKILHYEHGVELLPTNDWPCTTEQFSRMIK